MKRLLIFAIIIGTLLFAPMVAQADIVTFTGGAGTTDWNTAKNWSPARVPTQSDDVTIPSGQTVTNKPFAALGTGFINSLTLLGTLTIDTSGLSLQSTTATSTINNLTLTSTQGIYSQLTMQGPTTFVNLALSPGIVNGDGAATINGPVTVSTGNSSLAPARVDNKSSITVTQNNLQVTLGTSSFINDTTGAINLQGDGITILGSGTFTNSGSIAKSMGTGTSILSPSGPFNNIGSIAAQSGRLQLSIAGTNTGAFSASTGAILQFANVITLNGGTTIGGSGTIDITAGGAWDVEDAVIVDTPDLTFNGQTGTMVRGVSSLTINSASVVWNSGVLGAQTGNILTLAKGVTMAIATNGYHGLAMGLDLLGTVNMSADLDLSEAVITIEPGTHFNILTDNGIHGGGNIYDGGIFQKTQSPGGTSNIDYNGIFNITAPKGSHPVTVDQGILNFAVNSGVLGGIWTVDSSATLKFTRGTYTLPDGSEFIGGGMYLTGANWNLTENVSVSTRLFIMQGSTISGAFDLNLSSHTILLGGSRTGELQFGQPTGTIKILKKDSIVTVFPAFTLDACTLDNSSRSLKIEGTVTVQDSAVLLNEQSGTIFLDIPTGQNTTAVQLNSGTFSNLGAVTLGPAGANTTQTIAGAPWDNAGNLSVPSGFTLSVPGGYVNLGGAKTINGGTIILGGTMDLEGGMLDGTGVINGTPGINDTGGTVEAGPAGSNKTGILSLNVPLTQGTGAAITALVSGTKAGKQYDQINSTSSMALGGTLNLQFGTGFTPTPSESFNILNFSSVTGSFSTVNAPSGFTANLNFTSTALTVTFTSGPKGSIQPKAAIVKVDGMRQFTGTAGLANGVTWKVEESGGGTVTQTGLYTAPATPGRYHVVVTSVADRTKSDTATVTVTARVAHALMAASNPTAAAQQPSGIPWVRGTLVGPRATVFDTKNQCELIDIPDAPARAFVDYQGMVHLVSSHYVMRANIGPTLETVQHDCDVAYWSRHDPNPADWNDNTWLDSFYSIDGTNVVALGHMEYHGWEHPGECDEQGNYSAACWYNGDTFHVSHDGGYHFGSFKPPANYILSVPYQYVVDAGPEGYSIDTNIVKSGDWYYAIATGWSWPGNCPVGNFNCLVYGGAAPIRTSDITDPASWRAWDGQDFDVTFADPYLGPVANPFEHIFTPVAIITYANAINFHPASNLFVATLFDPFNNYYGPPGIYLSTSPDLINWSQPTVLVTIADLLAKEPPGNWTYGYASLLDPDSTDPNFSSIGDTPYLYYVRSDANDCCYVRVLYRQRIKLNWSQGSQVQ